MLRKGTPGLRRRVRREGAGEEGALRKRGAYFRECFLFAPSVARLGALPWGALFLRLAGWVLSLGFVMCDVMDAGLQNAPCVQLPNRRWAFAHGYSGRGCAVPRGNTFYGRQRRSRLRVAADELASNSNAGQIFLRVPGGGPHSKSGTVWFFSA